MFYRQRSKRATLQLKIYWDYFAEATGSKVGYLGNLSRTGCLLQTNEIIDTQRWLRILISEKSSHLYFYAIGRIVRKRKQMAVYEGGMDITLYHYGVAFTRAYPKLLESEKFSECLTESWTQTLGPW